MGIIPARSVYFYSYDLTKNTLKPKIGLGSLNAAISGIMAGFTSNTVTNPIWMVKTRMQLLSDTTVGQKAYTSYPDAIKTIYREEGLGGFYRGITASYWGCAEGCVQFVLYEKLKGKLIDRENNRRKAEGKKAGESRESKWVGKRLSSWRALNLKVKQANTTPFRSSFARSFVRLSVRSFIHSFIHSSFMHSFVHAFIHCRSLKAPPPYPLLHRCGVQVRCDSVNLPPRGGQDPDEGAGALRGVQVQRDVADDRHSLQGGGQEGHIRGHGNARRARRSQLCADVHELRDRSELDQDGEQEDPGDEGGRGEAGREAWGEDQWKNVFYQIKVGKVGKVGKVINSDILRQRRDGASLY